MIEEKTVQARDGTTLTYTIRKNNKKGEWILLLHGAWGNSSGWKKWYPHLKEYNTLALDFRNRGKSERGQMSITKDIEDIRVVLEKEKKEIKKVHIIANSYGSVVAGQFYQIHPSKVGKMVLCGIFAPPVIRFPYILRMLSFSLEKITSLFPRKKRTYVEYTKLTRIPDAFVWWYDRKGMFFADMMKALHHLTTTKLNIQHIACPTLFVLGKSDPFIKVKKVQSYEDAHKKVLVLKGKHRLIFKEEKHTMLKVRDFLKE